MLEILIKKGEDTVNLDLYDDESVSINLSINTIKDISNTSGSFTKTIMLPNTPKNRQLFGYITDLASDTIYNYDNNNAYNPNKKVKCYILEDSLPVLEGYIQLNRYSLVDDNAENIEATIYGDNTSFFISMGDLLLTDMDFSEYNFRWTRQTITASWTNEKGAYQTGVYFPLIDYGHGWTYEDLTNLKTYSLDVKDFLPAVFVKTIWDKIFKTNGFNYSSNFLGSNITGEDVVYPDDRFGNLVIPFNLPEFKDSDVQNRIFHLGITYSDYLSQYCTYSTGWYLSEESTLTHSSTYSGYGPKVIVNAAIVRGFESSDRYLWYNGYLLNPFATDPNRNTFANDGYSTWHYATSSLSLGMTTSPMFNNNNNEEGIDIFDITNQIYTNRATDIFKQRFIVNTDIVTNYSIQSMLDLDDDYWVPTGTASVTHDLGYIMKVEFFRSIDPNTGITASTWDSGYGFQIPADLGVGLTSGGYNICVDPSGITASLTHWVKDVNHKSNCFTKAGNLIVPTGTKRYLGDYCTTYKGDKAIRYTGDIATFSGPAAPFQEGMLYKYNSGACVTWYYNDAYNQSDDNLKGLWVSSRNESYTGLAFFNDSYTWVNQASFQPIYGDWYQQLQLQTIFLDGDQSNYFYGEGGIYLSNGNAPIKPGEQVRCVVTFGSKYGGQATQPGRYSYKPPVCATLLSTTNFTDGTYSFTQSNKPLTQMYNDVKPEYITGQLIKYNDIIPKNVKQRDFILEVKNMHNLYFEPYKGGDKYPNTLIIEPRDDYYNLSTEVLDWRDKLDISNPMNIQIFGETQYKRTRFSYKDDSDYYNKAYKQDTNEVYGQFIYSLDNQFLTNELKIESGFSPTPLSQLYSYLADGTDTLLVEGGFVLPVYVDSSYKRSSLAGANLALSTNYRIGLKNIMETTNGQEIYMFSNFSVPHNVKTNRYPYVGPYDNPYVPTYSLNWGQTIGEFFAAPTDQFFNNLVNTYWSSLLSEMGDANSRVINCKMFLNVNDINNFYFYKQVFLTINGVDGYYKVLNISDYIPGKNALCSVQLLRTDNIKNVFSGSNNH